MKTSIFIALSCTLLLAVLDSCSGSLHNLEVGQRVTVCAPQDKLFNRELIKEKGLSRHTHKFVKTFTTDGKARITAIKALDQKSNGNNGKVTLVGGGPGTTYATLQFESQPSHGVDFIVEIYAKY